VTDLSEDGAAFEVRGPSASVPSVEAWAPAYIPYEPRGESRRLRDELRRMIGGLRARDGEILHCAFSGWKPDNADIENVLLYNVHDSGGGGTSFRTGSRGPPSDALGRPVGKSLLVPTRAGRPRLCRLALGRRVRKLAFRGPRSACRAQDVGRRLVGAQALGRADICSRAGEQHAVLCQPDASPAGRAYREPRIVAQGLLDGVVCAFQVHWDHRTVDAMASRLAKHIDAPGPAIAAQLVDERRAVLGGLRRLVHARGKGVQWRPDDHLLVAGSLLLKPPLGEGGKLSGAIHEVRSTSGE